MARRLRQVVDLYISGKVAELRDGSPLWVQVLNPYEQDTARNEAQIAKARLVMALKEFGSDEQAKVRMFFFEDGLDAARAKVIDARVAEALPRVLDKFRNDPEWTERLTILERGLDDTAAPVEGAEQELLAQLGTEYATELGSRLQTERSFLEQKFSAFEEDELWEEYLDWYLNRRASEMQFAEYRLHQILYGVRWCEGVKSGEHWDHSACDGHQARTFLDKEEVRRAPEELIALLMDAADDVEMTVREAKNSHRQGSSYDSSPLPSEAAESTASTPVETPVAPPGSSSSPSPTPSPSSASVS